MTKKWICECDLCGAQVDEHKNYILEIRPDLAQNQVGEESWDICPDCRTTLLEFFKTRKQDETAKPEQGDIPLIHTGPAFMNTHMD